MESAGGAEGCSACGVGPFKNKQEHLWHAVSLQHHRILDASSQSWFHICDLCKAKVGSLQNYIDHVGGRKHQNALGMYHRTHSSEKKKKQQPSVKLKKVKVTVKGKHIQRFKGTINAKAKAKQHQVGAKQAKQASSVVKKKTCNSGTPKKAPPTESQRNGASQRKKSTSSHDSNSNTKEEEALEGANKHPVEPENKPKKKPIAGISTKPVAGKKGKKPLVESPDSSKPVVAKQPKKSPVDLPGTGKPVVVKQSKKPLVDPPSDSKPVVVKQPKKPLTKPPSSSTKLVEEKQPKKPLVESPSSSKPVATEQPTEEPVECDSSSPSSRRNSSHESKVSALSKSGKADEGMYNANWNNSHGCYPARPNGRGAPFTNYRGGRGRGPWHGSGPPFLPPFNLYGGPAPFNRFGRHPLEGGIPPWADNCYGFNSYGDGGGQDSEWQRDSYNDDRWQFSSASYGYSERDGDGRLRESFSHDGPGSVDHDKEALRHPSRPNSSASTGSHHSGSSRPGSPTSSTKSQQSDGSLVRTSRSSAVGSANGGASSSRRKSEAGEKGSSAVRAQTSVKGDSVKEKSAASAGKRPQLPLTTTGARPESRKIARVGETPRVPASPSEKSGSPRARDERTRVLTTVSVSPGLAKQRQSITAKEVAAGSPSANKARTKVLIKKEAVESAEDAAEGAVSAPLSKGSHLIFLSSEDEEHDSDGKSTAKRKSSKSESEATTVKKPVKKTKTGGVGAAPSTPERDSTHAALSKSPRIGPVSTKDMYRRDVLDKLVNFPSSRQVQTQLNKWMMEMQKHQKSVSWRQTLRLCSTQARVEREEDPLSGLPNIDFDVLVRQVEACELPEEMLRSLMQALSSDVTAEQPQPQPVPSTATDSSTTSIKAAASTSSAKMSSVAPATSSGAAEAAAKTPKKTSGGTALSSGVKVGAKASVSSAAAKSSAATTSAVNDEDEIIVLPTPPKVVVSVNLVDSEEEEASTDEEGTRPSTTTPASKSLAKEPDTNSPQTASTQPADEEMQQTQRPASRGSRHPSECSGANSSDDESRLAKRGAEKGAAKSATGETERPGSRAKSATPTASAALGSAAAALSLSSSAPLNCHDLHLPSQMTPPPLAVLPKPPLEQPAAAPQLLSSPVRVAPPMVITKMEPPSPPQSHQGQVVDELSTQAVRGVACPPPPPPPPEGGGPKLEAAPTPPIQLKSLVDELSVRCQQEDTIRQQLGELERSIASALATLEELRRKKDELLAREAQVRKERLEILQCLQGATSAVPGSAALLTPPQQNMPAADMPPSFTLGSGEVLFKVSQVPQGAPSTIAGQVPGGGVVLPPQSSTAPTAQDIAQLLLPHLRQFGDIDLGSLAAVPVASSSSSSMPTMSPEVSRGPSTTTKNPMPKRKARDREGPTTTRKRPRAADGEIEDLRLEQIPSCQEITAHDLAVVALKLHGHFVYSSSNDCTARRHDLLDPSQCVKYLGSTKTVNSLEVSGTKSRAAVLYTTSLDGILRSYDPETGDCTDSFDVQAPVVCSAMAWGKMYLGLQTGHITVFNLKTRKLQDSFYCSNTSVNCITTTTEGAQKLLCTISLDGSITVRDPSTGLLFRCLDGCVHPPCCIVVNNGTVYTTSTDRTIRLHELRTGCLQKVYDCKSAATGIHFQKGFIIWSSFDGLIRFYRVKDFSCEMVYYGAGKNMVTSMDVNGPLIATGNRKGKLEVIKIDKSHLQMCEIRGCNLRFAREEDLMQHLRREHIGLGGGSSGAGGGGGGSMTCPWTQCQMSFAGPHCAKDFEKHLMDHACT